MIRYILECMVFQLLFLIIYDLFLKRETFFQWNRAYLLGTFALSLLLPLTTLHMIANYRFRDHVLELIGRGVSPCSSVLVFFKD